MNQKDVSEQWGGLCDAHEAARDKAFRLRGLIFAKHAAVGRGDQTASPSMDELKAADDAEEELERIVKEMKDFVKRHR
jgi:hypothetical protein